MQKPTWVRTCGWLGVTALGAAVLLNLGVTLTRGDPAGAAVAVALALGSLPWFFLWAVGTLVHRSRVHRARIKAAAIEEQHRAQFIRVKTVDGKAVIALKDYGRRGPSEL